MRKLFESFLFIHEEQNYRIEKILSHNTSVIIQVCLIFSLLGRVFYLDNQDFSPPEPAELYNLNPCDFTHLKTLENKRGCYEQ